MRSGLLSSRWIASTALCLLCMLIFADYYYHRSSSSNSSSNSINNIISGSSSTTIIISSISRSTSDTRTMAGRRLYEWSPKPKIPHGGGGGSDSTSIVSQAAQHSSSNNININNDNRGSAKSCEFNFKLYIYELPPSLIANAEAARSNSTYHVCRKCIFEQFALGRCYIAVCY